MLCRKSIYSIGGVFSTALRHRTVWIPKEQTYCSSNPPGAEKGESLAMPEGNLSDIQYTF